LSLKEDINLVKDELSSEEKFFEKAVVTEKFVKKYKKVIIGSVIAITVVVAGDLVYEWNKQQTIAEANIALMQLQNNPKDEAALAKLQTLSPVLYDVWRYSKAVVNQDVKTLESLEGSKALLIGDLSTYEAAQTTQNKEKLLVYTQKQGAIYRDLAQVEIAIIDISNNKIDEAHTKLAMISENSPLSNIAKALMHYGVK
jgi:hypothetical protein